VAEPRRSSAGRRAALVLAALLAVATLAVALAACGDDSAASPDDPLVGYWIGGGAEQMSLLQIGKDGDTYTVASNPDQPMGDVKQEGDSLVIDTHVVSVRISPVSKDEIAMEFTGDVFKEPQTVALSRVNETEYSDGATAYGVLILRRGLAMWKAGGGKKYPPAKEVMPDGMLAKMIAWPANLFTGGPMVQEASTGNFAYELIDGGKKYSLKAYLSDGSTIGN
jgi:hypothetical protein